MSKRAVLTAIILVSTGILFGAVLVSSFSGSGFSMAGPSVSFDTNTPFTPSQSVLELNQTFRDVAAIMTPQVVHVEVKTPGRRVPSILLPFGFPDMEGQEERLTTGSGSGIILTDNGYILTNRHVIDKAVEDGIKVTLNDTREFTARVIGEDENTDIAVIKIDASGLSPASLGNSEQVQVGDWVIAVGNPLGLNSTVTAGIVSAISRNIRIIGDRRGFGIENFIQTDAVINPGNSGGALVNLQGQVIGVNTAIATSGMEARYIGYGFAVPINLAKVVADALIRDGKFVRGYIGIRIDDIDAKTAEALGLDRYRGVLVQSLVPGGAGEAAGVKEGDAIVEVNGKAVESANQLQARVGMHHPGDKVTLKLWRDGKYISVPVVLRGQDNEEVVAATSDKEKKEKKSEAAKPAVFDKAGFTVSNMDSATKQRMNRESGVVVSDIKRNHAAFDSGLRPGMVIFEAIRKGQKYSIDSVSDFKKFAESLDANESILLRVQLENGDAVFLPMKAPL